MTRKRIRTSERERWRALLVLALAAALVACAPSRTDRPTESAHPSASGVAGASPSVPSVAGSERVPSSAGVVFDAGTLALGGLPSAGQPPPGGAILHSDQTVVGGGPTDAGAQGIEDIAELAFQDVDAFWRQNWESGYPTIFYESVAGLTFYNSADGVAPQSSCVRDTDAASIWAVNAFYCFGDHAIAYDVVLAAKELSDIGDFAIVGTVAHEWGHHLQNLIRTQRGVADTPVFSIESELQADCFAGMYTAGAGRAGTFPVSVDDVQEAAESFYTSGTEAKYGWFAPVFHGSGNERRDAFLFGYGSTDVRACDTYATYGDRQTVSDGPYEIGYLADTTVDYLPSGAYELRGPGYGSTTLVVDAVEVGANTWDASLVEAIRGYAPNADGTDTGISVVGEGSDYSETTQSWGIPGRTVGFYYTYSGRDARRHGYMIVNLSPGADVLILDARVPGEAVDDSYQRAAAVAEIAIHAFQAPGLL